MTQMGEDGLTPQQSGKVRVAQTEEAQALVVGPTIPTSSSS